MAYGAARLGMDEFTAMLTAPINDRRMIQPQ